MIEIIGYVVLLILIFLGVLYAIYLNDKKENKRSFWQESKGFIIGGFVFFLLMGGCARSCGGSSSRYNSDGFNEVTGEYDQQRVIDHFYK